ncbi:MAG: hypothetical protein UZ21_OP11001000570 [Microgenomates bacterium OLB22]|nr:MAG: hypothetical protein UZ21_OP11001000570 [Microgenomates bacterium OLB22]
MDPRSPEFLYIGFVLPMLFSLTLVGEGLYKISKQQEGYMTFFLGLVFLMGIIVGFFFCIC